MAFLPPCSSQPFLSVPAKAFGCAERLHILQRLVLGWRKYLELSNSLKGVKETKEIKANIAPLMTGNPKF